MWVWEFRGLPVGMHNLTSLQHLTIGGVPSLLCFTEDGMFPTKLHSLKIDEMKIWKSLTESSGFHRFTSLRILAISGCDEDMVSFPLEDIGLRTTLSASLTQLEIFNCPNLESLSSSSICDQNLTSLKLINCLKLKNFPKMGLPVSLLRLEIEKCPLIEKRCRQDRGQYWHLVIHVSCVWIKFSCTVNWVWLLNRWGRDWIVLILGCCVYLVAIWFSYYVEWCVLFIDWSQ